MIWFEADYPGDNKHSNGETELKNSEMKISQEKEFKKPKSKIATKPPNRKDMWARPELKVRFIDKRFRVIIFFMLKVF